MVWGVNSNKSDIANDCDCGARKIRRKRVGRNCLSLSLGLATVAAGTCTPEEADKHDVRPKMDPSQAVERRAKSVAKWTNCQCKVNVGARGKEKDGDIKFSWQGGNTCS